MTTLTITASPTSPARPVEGTLAFERNDEHWHIRIYSAADGTAIIERLRGGSARPCTWISDRTAQQWVDVQRNCRLYVPA